MSVPSAFRQDSSDDQWSGANDFFPRLTEAVQAIPGIETVAISYTNPLEPLTAFGVRFEIEGLLERPRAERPMANLQTVSRIRISGELGDRRCGRRREVSGSGKGSSPGFLFSLPPGSHV